VPFLLSIVLLGVSLWMRLKLNESPVFRAMKAQGEISHNPLVESFTWPGNKKRIFVALFGVACGLTIVFYTAFFSTLSFLKGPMRVEDTVAELIVGGSSIAAMGFMLWFGHLSDRIGRKKPIVWGYVASLLLIFPVFWGIGALANPQLAQAQRSAPIALSGPGCTYDPLAARQASECGMLMGELTDKGIPHDAAEGPQLTIAFGAEVFTGLEDQAGSAQNRAEIARLLEQFGYAGEKQIPPALNIAGIVALMVVAGALTGATYGPVASLLSEMFPPKIRYSSMSIPYHIGSGYFGGFLPLIAGYIVAVSGDIYAGLWYTWVLLVVALVVAMWGLRPGPPKDFTDD
jgi:MFS family permease